MRLHCKHVLAQVVDYKSNNVQLLTWHHLITGKEPANFLKEIAAVDGLRLYPVQLEQARAALADRSILAYIAVPLPGEQSKSTVFMIDGVDGTEHEDAEKVHSPPQCPGGYLQERPAGGHPPHQLR